MLDKEFIEKQSKYLNEFSLSFADVAIENIFSIIDPEAPEVKEIALKFAENREVDLGDNKVSFENNWSDIYDEFSLFLSNLKKDEKTYLSDAKVIANNLTEKAYEQNKAEGLSEIIIGSLDLIVFIYSRYFELKAMIAELFKYEGEDKDDEFIKILEHTFLQFSEDCKKEDEDKVYDEFFQRVASLFNQSLILSSIALMSRQTREGTA